VSDQDVSPLAVFRTDASVTIGAGHARRCLALADVLAGAGWQSAFATREESASVVRSIAGGRHRILELAEGAAEPDALRRFFPGGCALLVVDHYGLDRAFESACRVWARCILVIDDLANREHACDLLLDQTPGRAAGDYRSLVPAECAVLAGSTFALLDRRYRAARLEREPAGERVARILVNFGGVDAADGIGLALAALAKAALGVEVDVALGAASPNLARVQALAATLGPAAHVHVDTADMAGLAARADLAIGAGGVSALERCCIGLPAIVVTVAENQRGNAESLARLGAIVDLGPIESVTADALADALRALASDRAARAEMRAAGAGACDGLGAWRVCAALGEPLRAKDGGAVALRPASFADSQRLLAWQSEPGQRRFARNRSIPAPAEHERWLRSKLGDRGCVLSIIAHRGEAAGVLRYDWRPGERRYEASLLIARAKQGLGVGAAALEAGARLLPDSAIVAEIDPENTASKRAFAKAGYVRQSERLWTRAPSTLADARGCASQA
jgi:UDP-2,4-diacetamido-2,4,6-trideoxy-beta-L-altropyranose hydrolase